ncbi:serine/threonine-protein kinase [Streptomyces caeruleatus]|uniref:Serine/threonine protein kinase n=1 Tax=Streptomyces caeruleatus TaxID=661399 RepID=A0A101U4A8_9ACTN|nr:serine/threonine-protein kinase [Streptomyces caeruleatus]KUO03971.1 serine/threonine protein kinase [Streptomyces caeruleatus]
MNAAPLGPEDPTELGEFELLGRIGHGGMGQVYLGESPGGEPAAVKVIKPSVVDSETRLRFAQEVEVLKTVWGPRIAAFMDADPDADQPWLATEYVDGPDLRKQVNTCGPLPTVLVASLGATLAEALSGVHKQGLLHRDLKPANILLGPNGPKIIDFGLAVFTESSASLTAPNTVMGTPTCMAPEQANGVKPLLAPVDVYALGAVLLYAATGHYPFQADNIHALFHLITKPEAQADLTGVPEQLVPLLTAMLAYDATARPTLQSVVQQCRAVIEGEGLKVAQARRRLTAYTAATAPQESAPLEPAPLEPAPQESEPQESESQEVTPAPKAPAVSPATHTPTTVKADPAVAVRRPARAPQVRHSAQARRVAQQLRETYAQRAKF